MRIIVRVIGTIILLAGMASLATSIVDGQTTVASPESVEMISGILLGSTEDVHVRSATQRPRSGSGIEVEKLPIQLSWRMFGIPEPSLNDKDEPPIRVVPSETSTEIKPVIQIVSIPREGAGGDSGYVLDGVVSGGEACNTLAVVRKRSTGEVWFLRQGDPFIGGEVTEVSTDKVQVQISVEGGGISS